MVGASGVGKDAILSAARPRLEATGNYYFPTRFITRPADAGGEDHNSMSSKSFVQAVREDRFSLWWMAHELHYALPDTVYEKLRFDSHVVANISRRTVIEAVQKFNHVVVIEITASPETIRKRLLMRGRETEAEVMMRQMRKVEADWSGDVRVTNIANDGQLDEAVGMFIATILSFSNSKRSTSSNGLRSPGSPKIQIESRVVELLGILCLSKVHACFISCVSSDEVSVM